MSKREKAAIYARDLPIYPENEVLGVYYEDKWSRLIGLLDRGDVDTLYVGCPEVLGDDYLELLVNLSKIAAAGVKLRIGRPSRTIRNLGAIGDEGTGH
jgi:hypothetical protein